MRRSMTALRNAGLAAAALSAAVLPTIAIEAMAAGGGASGVAHVSSNVPACVARTGYYASVSGSAIASVTFTLDGRRVARVHKPNSRGAFAARVGLTAGRAHVLAMTVDFAAASHARPMRFVRTVARCAAKIKKKPTTTTSPSSETLAFTG